MCTLRFSAVRAPPFFRGRPYSTFVICTVYCAGKRPSVEALCSRSPMRPILALCRNCASHLRTTTPFPTQHFQARIASATPHREDMAGIQCSPLCKNASPTLAQKAARVCAHSQAVRGVPTTNPECVRQLASVRRANPSLFPQYCSPCSHSPLQPVHTPFAGSHK